MIGDEPLPISHELRGDDAGNAWVAEYAVDRVTKRYRVFSPEGAWLGWVVVPSGVEILDIDVARGRVLALHTDPFDVDAVAIHPLEPAGR